MSHKTFVFGIHADSQQECSLRLDVCLYCLRLYAPGSCSICMWATRVCNLRDHTFLLSCIWAPHLLVASHLVQNPGQAKHCRYRQVQGQSQFYTLLKPWHSDHQVWISNLSNCFMTPFGSTVISSMAVKALRHLEGRSPSASRVKADWNWALQIVALSFASVFKIPCSQREVIPETRLSLRTWRMTKTVMPYLYGGVGGE